MNATATDQPTVAARRAVEALRAGVPSAAAVAALGTAQPDVEDRFGRLLAAVTAIAEGAASPPGGMLIGAGFGAGKTHLLTHLARVAANTGMVVSRVVVSKETPLHDPVKVFRTAVATAVVPGYHGDAVSHLADRVDVDSPAWADLHRHVHTPTAGLDPRFAASVALYGRRRLGDDEFTQTLVRFWAGDPIRVAGLRARLKTVPELAGYQLGPARERDLCLQRFGFVARLARAAGYRGWIILFDEAELIGRYTAAQRTKAYAELGWWLHGRPQDPHAPLAAVVAITDDFEAAVLTAKGDYGCLPAKLRAKDGQANAIIADAAETGMRAIERDLLLLRAPTGADLDRAYTDLKSLHADAFGWDPPDVAGLERLSTTRMRQYVRAWINEWDLRRADPSYRPTTQTVDITTSYREDPDLERGSEPD